MAAGSFPSADQATQREAMVREQLVSRGIRDQAVLRAMRTVPRHEFVPQDLRDLAYEDGPLAIGEGQTISQPFVVARMIEALELAPSDRVLEIGTGSGYAAAILSTIALHVLTVERHPSLRASAARRLAILGFGTVRVEAAGDVLGWPAEAPFDAILVSAGAPVIPTSLRTQLVVAGRMVIPVGDRLDRQQLTRVTRTGVDVWTEASFGAVSFVPLVGTEAWPRD